MGATEAVRFLNVLSNHRLLSRRTIAQYVVPALVGGTLVREGTPAYRQLEEAVYGEVHGMIPDNRAQVGGPDDGSLDTESVTYMRMVLACVNERNPDILDGELAYNGFSRQAYLEVYETLGSQGRRYLGIDGNSGRLNLDERRISAIRREETYANDVVEDSHVLAFSDLHGNGGLGGQYEFGGPPEDSIPHEDITGPPEDFPTGIPPIDGLPVVGPYRMKTPI